MKSWLILIVFLAVSCSRLKDMTERNSINHSSHQSEETTYIEKKDTTFDYRPAPEKSQNQYTADSSYLETSLARSMAKWHDGILTHSIENKPSISIRAPNSIEFRTLIIRDTTTEYLSLTNEHTRTIEKYRFLNTFFYYTGSIVWLAIIILITIKLWKIYRQQRKF